MQLQLILAHDEVVALENRHEQFQAWPVPRLPWLPLLHTGQRMLPRIGREGNLPSTRHPGSFNCHSPPGSGSFQVPSTGSLSCGPWANVAYQRCCGDKHPSYSQGSSVPAISSKWLLGDKQTIHCFHSEWPYLAQ